MSRYDTLMGFLQNGMNQGMGLAGKVHDKNAALEQLLQGKKSDLANKLQEIQAQGSMQKDVNSSELSGSTDAFKKAMKDPEIQDAISKGNQLGITKGGFTLGKDPTSAAHAHDSTEDAKARKHVLDAYNAAVGKMQPEANEFGLGVKAVNDSKNTMALGAAKGILLKAYGINRFNEAESNTAVPATAQKLLSQWDTYAGGDGNALTDRQKRDFNYLMTQASQMRLDAHQQAQQSAVRGYQANPFATPNGVSAIQGAFNPEIQKSFQGIHDTAQKAYSDYDAAEQAKAQQGGGGLRGFFGGMFGGKQQSANAQPAPQMQAPPSAAPQTLDTPLQQKKVPVQKFHNTQLNKTRLVYGDGTEEIQDGLQ